MSDRKKKLTYGQLLKFINIDYLKGNFSNTESIFPKHFANYRSTEFTNY